jgi:uncharacterized protein (TIGR03492 family)
VLLVSNGHGEDVVGARVAESLLRRRPDLRVRAFPLVGLGAPYLGSGIECVGPRRSLPSGGLLLHSLPLLLADLRAGFVGLTAAQLGFLARQRPNIVLVVGDVYAQLLAGLARPRARFVIQTLVSAHHAEGVAFSSPNRVFMERITLLERLLMRYLAARVYVRDRLTEDALKASGLGHVACLGNPIADALEGSVPGALIGHRRVVAMLPGSRAYARRALQLMLAALERIPGEPLAGVVAWAGGELGSYPGWKLVEPAQSDRGLIGELVNGRLRVPVYRDRFADILLAARVVLGTSGTANEQAVALARPVVAFPVPPDYSNAFLANQKRLLGPALTLAPAQPAEVAAAVHGWLDDPAKAELAGRQGQARVGGAGGSEAIAADLLEHAAALGVC